MFRYFSIILAVCVVLSVTNSTFAQNNKKNQKGKQAAREIIPTAKQFQDALTIAENHAKSKNFEKSVDMIKLIVDKMKLVAAKGDSRAKKSVRSLSKRLVALSSKLELEGYSVPRIPSMDAKPGTEPAAEGTSFVKEVAPILVAKCGRCHVDRTSGQFSMVDYSTLIRGPMGNRVILAGKPDDSRLIESIVEGDMPRGGKVEDAELAILKKWVTEGAKFDGDDRNDPIKSLVPNMARPNQPRLDVAKATGKETISFGYDIAPILIERCSGCHLNADRIQGGFNMGSMRTLIRGGDGGAPFVPGEPAESNIVKRIKGEMERMPPRGAPLTSDQIKKIETWIKEGAKFDGGDVTLDTNTVASVSKAKRQTHEELAKERKEASEKNWRLGMPNISSNQVETDNLLVIGNQDPELLAKIGQIGEKVIPKIARAFKTSSRAPFVKGKITLYVFKQRYDYSEFGKMVEKRDLPRNWKGHFRYDIVNAYGAIMPTDDEDKYLNEVLIGQQIAGIYAASLGPKTPKWFAEGSARVAATRIDKKDPRIQNWEDEAKTAITQMQKPTDFLSNQMNPEQSSLVSYLFVSNLMKSSRQYGLLLTALKKGNEFDRAFEVIYGGKPTEIATRWLGGGKGNRRK